MSPTEGPHAVSVERLNYMTRWFCVVCGWATAWHPSGAGHGAAAVRHILDNGGQ